MKKSILKKLFCGILTAALIIQPLGAVSAQNAGEVLYQNDFESEDLSAFVKDDVSGYGTDAISEVVDSENEEHGKVWRLTATNDHGLPSMAYCYCTAEKYTDFSLYFDMKTPDANTDDEKPMINLRNEDGNFYQINLYQDKISVVMDNQPAFVTEAGSRGNDWNSYAIHAIGTELSISMNGEEIIKTEIKYFQNVSIEFNGWRHTAYYDNIRIVQEEPNESQLPEPIDFSLLDKQIQLSIGDSVSVSPIYEDIADKKSNFSYQSNNESVATVNEYGIITAHSTGEATITATAGDGASASVPVTVNTPCNTFYYVSPDGNDATGDGSLEAPFATIEKARDTIRSLESIPDGGITVYLRGGEYYVENTIEFTPEDSGEAGKPIVYASYPEEKAIVHSGKKLEGFHKLTADEAPEMLPEESIGNVYVTDVESGWRFHDIYVNGKRQQIAREFNTNDWSKWNTFPGGQKTPGDQRDERGTQVIFPENALEGIPDNGDVEVCLLTAQWWNNLSVLKNVNLEDNTAWLESFNANWGNYWSDGVIFQNNGRYNLMNAPKFLDEPGEWCIDSENGKVYWWPKNSQDLENAIAPKAYELIRMQGDEEEQNWANQVAYIEFRDLTFMYTDRLPEDQWSDNKMDPDIIVRNSENTDAAIFMQGVENCVISDCSILCTGAYGVALDHYAKYNRITHNEMGNLGCGGVQLTGYGPGTKTANINTGNTILANYIHDTGLAPYMHSSAVTSFGSSYNDVKFNKMERLPYTAVMMTGTDPSSINPNSWNANAWFDSYGNLDTQYGIRKDEIEALGSEITDKFGNNIDNGIHAVPYQNSDYNITEYNISIDYMQEMNDGGCYYAWSVGKNNEFNFNIAEKQENAKHMCWPLYMDDWASFVKVEGNRVWAPQTSTLDKGAGRNIWKDNLSSSDMTQPPEGYDGLKSSILGVVETMGGYKETVFEDGYEYAPELEEITVAAVAEKDNRTTITMPELPQGASKFVMAAVSTEISAPHIGDIVSASKQLSAGKENIIPTSNGQKYAVYAVDDNNGVIAYANITAIANQSPEEILNLDFETDEQQPELWFKDNLGDFGRYTAGQISSLTETSDENHGAYVWKLSSGNTQGGTGIESMAYGKEFDRDLTDFTVTFDMKVTNDSDSITARVRSDINNNNGYGIHLNNNEIVIDKRSPSDTDVVLSTVPLTEARGTEWHTYQIQVTGNQIDVFMDGELIASASDSDNLYPVGGFSFGG